MSESQGSESGLAEWFWLRVCHGVAVKVSARACSHLKAWMRLEYLLPRWLTHICFDRSMQVCWLSAKGLNFLPHGLLHRAISDMAAVFSQIKWEKREREWERPRQRHSVFYNQFISDIPLLLLYSCWSHRLIQYSVEGMSQGYGYQNVGLIGGYLDGWCGKVQRQTRTHHGS